MIADVYHAMTSDRPYRKALTKVKAIEEFKRGKATQFDPMLVDVFVEIYKK
jgi:HD-GYP domain-containing protein (c-di-GMP phosphodiesterase class II)